MLENEIATDLLDICFEIHRKYGPGLFESVYEEILCYELNKKEIGFQRQAPIVIIHDGKKMDIGFRADIIVENCIIIEIKSIEKLGYVHSKQVLTYLRLTGLKLGLLINFNESYLKDGIRRVANNL